MLLHVPLGHMAGGEIVAVSRRRACRTGTVRRTGCARLADNFHSSRFPGDDLGDLAGDILGSEPDFGEAVLPAAMTQEPIRYAESPYRGTGVACPQRDRVNYVTSGRVV